MFGPPPSRLCDPPYLSFLFCSGRPPLGGRGLELGYAEADDGANEEEVEEELYEDEEEEGFCCELLGRLLEEPIVSMLLRMSLSPE